MTINLEVTNVVNVLEFVEKKLLKLVKKTHPDLILEMMLTPRKEK